MSSPEMSIALTTWSSPVAAWQISPEHTASRLLALVTLLRGLLTYDGLSSVSLLHVSVRSWV